MSVRKNLKEARLAKGWTEEQLAEAVGGLTSRHIRWFETGKKYPAKPQLARLEEALGVVLAAKGVAVREIRKRREALGWTISRLGHEVDLSYTHISNIERGVIDPKPETLRALNAALERGEKGEISPIPYGNIIRRRLRAADLCVGDTIKGRGRKATVIKILDEHRIKVRIIGEYGMYHSIWTDTPKWDWTCVGALQR